MYSYFDLYNIEVCSYGHSERWVGIGSGNDVNETDRRIMAMLLYYLKYELRSIIGGLKFQK